jgi:hypothetical protein
MRSKEQIIYDLNSDQFKYLKREENRILHRVDIHDLNKRLNETRKSSFYRTSLACVLSLLFLTILCFVGFKF